MISSITFRKSNDGFIGSKKKKPKKPKKSGYEGRLSRYRGSYDEAVAEYEREMEIYNSKKGKYEVECSMFLVDRRFEFSRDKVNVLFGPNASGKTTILNAIASLNNCDDGYGKLISPWDLGYFFCEPKSEEEIIERVLERQKELRGHNEIVCEYDGMPIYNHGFENKLMNNGGDILETLGKTVLGSYGEGLRYYVGSMSTNSANCSLYVLGKVFEVMNTKVTADDIFNAVKKEMNGTEKMCYYTQLEYYKSLLEVDPKESCNTFLFDEIDKNLDIPTTYLLFNDLLPKVISKSGQQIIVVSHSPFVLKEEIRERINLVSIDDKYTDACIECIKK